jgi:hypothetical protein
MVTGVLFILGGVILIPMAFVDGRRYPPRPTWVKKLRISNSDANWIWRYRMGSGGAGAIFLFGGVMMLIGR